APRTVPSFPTRRSSDLAAREQRTGPRMGCGKGRGMPFLVENAFQFHTPHRSLSRPARNPRTLDAVHAVLGAGRAPPALAALGARSEEHTSELQSRSELV